MSVEALTAIATMGLLITTGIYAYLTWKLAKAANISLGHAAKAAAAAERSAAVAEAGLPIRFRAQYMDTALGRHLNIWNDGSRIVLHGARLDIWMFFSGGKPQDFDPVKLETLEPGELPATFHRGEGTTFLAPNQVAIDTEKPFMGNVTLIYSLPGEKTVREFDCVVELIQTDEVDAWLRAVRGEKAPDEPKTEE